MAKTLSLSRFTRDAKLAVAAAQRLADKLEHMEVTSLHLLAELLVREAEVVDAFASLDVDAEAIERHAREELDGMPAEGEGRSFLGKGVIELLQRAQREAGEHEVAVADLLNALAREAGGPTRELLLSYGIGAGAFRSFFRTDGDTDVEVAEDEDGSALLRDFASEVKAELRGRQEHEIRQRGRGLIDRLEKQFTGADAVPGLSVTRDTAVRATKIILERLPVDAQVEVVWEMDSSAIAIVSIVQDKATTVRYVWNRRDKHWDRVDGDGSFYGDLRNAMRALLYPEMA